VDHDELGALLEANTAALRAGGAVVERMGVAWPTTADRIREVESALGLTLPASFREILTTVAAGVDWTWRTNRRFPAPFAGIESGRLHWSIDTLVDTHRAYQGWVDACFADPDDPYDAIWHGKLGFAAAPNGDGLALDLDPDRSGAVVHLSHDDGAGHGYVLADSLGDLLDRWVPLACPGPEDWQWLPFVPRDEGPIDPTCPAARRWIELVGLPDDPPRTELGDDWVPHPR